MTNENFTREMMSTTTAAKPITTTKKQTTTTTNKPTTTVTAKPMDKSTVPSEGPFANTPECVLASANSMLIGHRFNAA
uniref:Uncharacterized protein n=1 Tax=Globodera rostochiensis TaxID=31243 RepID=A0A914H168_GLORO